MNKWILPLLLSALVSGCAVNPVTGKSELSIVSAQQEVAIGEQNYAPSRQSQGGDYYLDPSLNRYVAEVGHKLAAVSDRPGLPYDFVVLNNSVPNAWALPGGKIAVNAGLLLHLEDEAQLAAVLGHEVVHAAARHGAAQMSRGTLLNIGLMAAAMGGQDSGAGQLFGLASQVGGAAWMAKYGREDELESDKYGMQYMIRAGYDPQAAVELQETFVKLSQGRKSDFISGLFASHPPSTARVAANRQHAQGKTGGVRNRERYQRAIAQLKKDEPAYKAATEAIKALNNKNAREAISQLDKAVAVQPDEGQFWELRGHAWKMLGNESNAEKAFTTAIGKNPSYFSHHLARGVLRYEEGNKSEGYLDVRRSYEILPTAVASYYLGETALAEQDYEKALGYYQQAASSQGEIGTKAKARLNELQIKLQPEKFLETALALDSRGYLVIGVINRSPVAMANVRLQVTEMLNLFIAGNSTTVEVPGSIPAGSRSLISTGIGPLESAKDLNLYTAKAISAKALEN